MEGRGGLAELQSWSDSGCLWSEVSVKGVRVRVDAAAVPLQRVSVGSWPPVWLRVWRWCDLVAAGVAPVAVVRGGSDVAAAGSVVVEVGGMWTTWSSCGSGTSGGG